jgi:hypothetical protein
MTESDYEKMRRELREMEGRNVAHYSVLLTAYIRTKVENARMTAVLSSAGIAFLVLILMLRGAHGVGKALIVSVGLVGFFIALWISLRVLEKSVDALMHSLKDGAGLGLDMDEPGFAAKKFFVLGCVCLIALGAFSVWTPKFRKMCCADGRVPVTASRISSPVSEPAAEATANKTFQVTAEFPLNSVATGSSSVEPSTTPVSQDAGKKAGNAGVFKRGVSQ